MNTIPSFFPCLNTDRTSCSNVEMPNSLVVIVALIGLGFLGRCYISRNTNNSLSGRATAGQTGNLFKTFEKNYLKLHDLRTPFLEEELRNDAPLMESLLAKWTITSQMRFFHFLGLDIYKECTSANLSEEDLNKFCTVYQKLCNGVAFSIKGTIHDEFFDEILKDFFSIAKLIPEKATPTFKFLLKILMSPEVAKALGKMRILYFERNEILDGEFTRKEDVEIFLDFASHLYPTELAFLQNNPKVSSLSYKLNSVLVKMQKKPKFHDDVPQISRYEFITIVKWTVDYRLLEKKIPTERFLANIQMFDKFQNSIYAHWFKQMSKEYLKNSEDNIQTLNFALKCKHHKENLTKECYSLIVLLVNEIPTQSLHFLEKNIIEKLQYKRGKCTPEAYAVIFADMVRFYQIVHDVYFLKDATKDHLEGRHIPDSFTDLAFLPEIQSVKEVALSAQLQTQETLRETLSTSPDLSEEEGEGAMSLQPKIKVKTRPVKVQIAEEQAGEEKKVPLTSVEISNGAVIEKPYFPERNVSGETVMNHLLNNGFIIEGTTGSHYQMHHVVSHVKITVPYHRSLKRGTLQSIRRNYYLSQGYE